VDTFGSGQEPAQLGAAPVQPGIDLGDRTVDPDSALRAEREHPPGLPFQVGLLVVGADPAVRHHDTGLDDRWVDQDRASRELPGGYGERPGVEPVQRGAVRNAVLLGPHAQLHASLSHETARCYTLRRTVVSPDGRASPETADATVPPGAYFLLGDNRAVSADSRRHGFVPADRLRGTLVLDLDPLRTPSGRFTLAPP
jgi:hypothetical protein